MKTGIVYMTKHGATTKVAEKIAGAINDGEVQLFKLSQVKNPDISEFDRILIGGSIHAGMIQKRVKDFCMKNIDILLQKKIGLFLCGMLKDQQKDQYVSVFPEELRKHALAYTLPGGEFNFDKMNFLEKAIVKKVSGINESISELDDLAIKNFVNEMMS